VVKAVWRTGVCVENSRLCGRRGEMWRTGGGVEESRLSGGIEYEW
jgi:hypothetical protein